MAPRCNEAFLSVPLVLSSRDVQVSARWKSDLLVVRLKPTHEGFPLAVHVDVPLTCVESAPVETTRYSMNPSARDFLFELQLVQVDADGKTETLLQLFVAVGLCVFQVGSPCSSTSNRAGLISSNSSHVSLSRLGVTECSGLRFDIPE